MIDIYWFQLNRDEKRRTRRRYIFDDTQLVWLTHRLFSASFTWHRLSVSCVFGEWVSIRWWRWSPASIDVCVCFQRPVCQQTLCLFKSIIIFASFYLSRTFADSIWLCFNHFSSSYCSSLKLQLFYLNVLLPIVYKIIWMTRYFYFMIIFLSIQLIEMYPIIMRAI
jgi:hypothetical protein